MTWLIKQHRYELEKTLLMGVVNITPDSFSDGGHYFRTDSACVHALQLVRDGADIIDLGAESTRPGADLLTGSEELDRLLPVLKRIRKETSALISIDTTKSDVARICLEEGADIINDVSGLRDSAGELAKAAAQFGAGLILMHRRGNAHTMQSLAHYTDTVGEVLAELQESAVLAVEAGVRRESIAVDPGLGFTKDAEQSLELVRQLERFHSLGYPVLLGPSRKSFIGHVTGREVGDREFGTAAVVADAVLKGVQIIRVHHVKAMRDVVRMAEAIRRKQYVRT